MQLFTNNSDSTLNGAIATGTTSITLQTGDGAKFPTPSGGDYFLATMYQKSGATEINHEIVKCTARTGDVLTVARAQEGTTARAFGNTDPIELRLTAGAAQAMARLDANTFTSDQDLGGNKLIKPLLQNTLEKRGTAVIAAGVLTLDMANGVTEVTLNANITSINFANNFASSTACQCHALETLGDGTARTTIWPAGNGTTTLLVRMPGGTAPIPTSTTGKRDRYFLTSISLNLWDLSEGPKNI